MNKGTIRTCFVTVVWLLLPQLIGPVPAHAEPKSPTPATTQNQPATSDEELAEEVGPPPAQVVIDGRPVLTVYEPIATLTPEDRAMGIKKRIVALAKSDASLDSLRLQPREAWTEIVLGNTVILAVTDADARMAGKSRQQLALEDVEAIRQTVATYRQEHSLRRLLRDVLYTALLTILLLLVLWLIQQVRVALRDRIQRWIQSAAHLEKKSAWQVSIAYFGPVMLAVGAFLRWLLILALIQAYLTLTLGFFPFTRDVSVTVTKWVFSQVSELARSAVNYLPNLLVLAVIVLMTNCAIRLVRLIFGEIARGELKIRGFYPDWAEPTAKLIRMLVLVLALIVAFPYLPGAKSPAFQGISIFLGLLLSLGSSSAVANAIAGVILTYMRSFLVGDWVQIGDTTGEVIEKTLLVTRILTPKAEIITIPNSTVMSGSVKNYSVEAKRNGVIFHTTATIGYDAPWRTVHQLLTSAALATQHVLREPAPFVLQTRLDDFYVAYELNAYTDAPREMLNIFSELHQNIQDRFNEAGVEICSPHFSSLRDGNTIAIPKQYVPPDYRARGFRLKAVETEDKSEVMPNPSGSSKPVGT
jgi:small-conductance mechanosensitive channel